MSLSNSVQPVSNADNDPAFTVMVTPEVIEQHGILPDEYKQIQEILGRDPNFTELGIFSVMWSEHCSYKNTRAVLKGFPAEKADKNSPYQVLVRMGEENAGIVDIGDGYAVCFKIESHNHPSYVEPFEGAATGIGGIVRDIFTMGARPVALSNSLRFGSLENNNVQRLFRGVVHGISHYGNCIGVPNVGGDVYFDECYEGNPLVNAYCMGVVRKKDIQRGAASGVGNPVYYVGPATGRDGMGGASFASKELSDESHEDRPAVQKGDPFMEKLLIEACLEMMTVPGLVVGIQDMGAAGLTCSTCETASRGDTGIEIDLDLVPQREEGMNSYEIMLSESQERMLVIAQKGREVELEAIFAKWDLPAVQIGEVKPGNQMVVKKGGRVIADIPAHALAEEAPIYHREAREPAYLSETRAFDFSRLQDISPGEALGEWLPRLLGEPTIAQKRWVWQQYDHMIMTGTVVVPGSDAGVIRLRLDNGSEKYVAIANDCNNRYCYLDPYKGGKIAMAECIRNLACSGAEPIGMTDNLNFGNPYKPEVFYTLKEAVKGLADACQHYDVPVTGGNVSLYNENPQGAIDPTPTVSVAGIIATKEMVTTQHLKSGDEVLYLIGGYATELGGSYYLKVAHNRKTGNAPDIDLEKESRQNGFLLELIRDGWINAAHDCSEGGLLVTIAEMCFAPDQKTFGASLEMQFDPESRRIDAQLLGESQGRIVIAVAPQHSRKLEERAHESSIELCQLGTATTTPELKLKCLKTGNLFAADTKQLRQIWEDAIPSQMNRE